MQTEEEFRTRLQDELRSQTPPPLGTLASDALSTGKHMRRRQRTLRVAGGTAALVAVAVGSATVSGAFASGSGTSATSAGSLVPMPAGPIPATWTVPPPAKVVDPVSITPQAVIAELQSLLPPGTASSEISGQIGYLPGNSRHLWDVDGEMTAATAMGPAEISVLVDTIDATAVPKDPGCTAADSCHTKLFADGSRIIVQRNYNPLGKPMLGAYVRVFRKDGVNVQVTVHDQTKWTDDQLFAVASSSAWGSMKMDKTFVDQAEASVKGDFKSPPA